MRPAFIPISVLHTEKKGEMDRRGKIITVVLSNLPPWDGCDESCTYNRAHALGTRVRNMKIKYHVQDMLFLRPFSLDIVANTLRCCSLGQSLEVALSSRTMQ